MDVPSAWVRLNCVIATGVLNKLIIKVISEIRLQFTMHVISVFSINYVEYKSCTICLTHTFFIICANCNKERRGISFIES